MTTSIVYYSGELRTESTHLQSGETYITDAPTDNEGKGNAFSPTDLIATGLANCMLTIMGIIAKRQSLDIEGTKAEVTKIMGTEPRMISEIRIDFFFPRSYDKDSKQLLQASALNCPVAKSLANDLTQTINFHY
ncbi:MAG: OsmC family protein [SAR86 cluster bacterium]|uniref:OsmC family protein n=1 Tax=marine metagenome TaxID=408172 RepID=A0A381U0Z4_9ZZZZ|nr:OsmC family protein [SAR86 cluster bacterium]